MWNNKIPKSCLCKNHLLGFHNEIHKFRPSFVKKFKIDGRLNPIVQIEPARMEQEHNAIAEEMLRRGYNHKSPYEQPDISYLPLSQQNSKTDFDYDLKDLAKRCPDCKRRLIEVGLYNE